MKPDRVSQVLTRFERIGPVEYLGPELVGVRCPICRDAMRLEFRGQLVDMTCLFYGCDEADAAFALLEMKQAA